MLLAACFLDPFPSWLKKKVIFQGSWSLFKAFWSRSGIGSKMHTFLIHFSGRCNVLVAKAQEWEAGNPGPASTSSPDFLFDLRRVASSPFIFIPPCPGNDSIPHEWQPM